ncbi:MAG: anthranilate 1,2-dioxygenase electron transfer component AntC [Marinomonas foliarum]|uniref:anthranilate 1,2-dioxygenase electron transfer component AntC n=1 Tax=Marinomonas foliarum TaxID=491950 RepID=UPI003F9D8DBC
MNHRVAVSFSDGQTVFFEAKHNEILLDAAFRNGLTLPVDCREGVCGTCKGLCESGKYEQDYVDEDALSESDLNARHILSCQTHILSPSSFYYDIDSTLCSKNQLRQFQAQITDIEQVADSSANLHLEVMNQDINLDYLAGQYARIKVPNDDVWRSYSFATSSSSETNHLQFLIRLLPQGAMSDYVRDRCKIGDTLTLEAPMGSFYLREIQRRQIFIAGGTGLSAFLAMLDEIVALKASSPTLETTPIELYYCVNNERDLCEIERIDHYKTQLSNFHYQLVISNPSDSYEGKRGLITEALDSDNLRENAFDMYICGPPPMIEAIKSWLQTNNIENGKLYFEKFVASNNS